MPKIKIENDLYDRIKNSAELAGYSSAEEFIIHLLETQVSQFEEAENDPDVLERLKGLGYI
jgi:hypothetical protein